jgi:hypothetical protein
LYLLNTLAKRSPFPERRPGDGLLLRILMNAVDALAMAGDRYLLHCSTALMHRLTVINASPYIANVVRYTTNA